jgi:hypothetical protein
MKHLLNKYCKLFTVATILLAAVSCRTGKEFTRQDFRTFTSAVELKFQSGETAKQQSISGQLRIIKDRAIQVSLRLPLISAEAVRINITPDNFTVIDRRTKTYAVEPICNLKLLFRSEHSFESLQQTLITKPVIIFQQDGFSMFLSISKPVFNREFQTDTSIPEKYRKTSLEQILIQD